MIAIPKGEWLSIEAYREFHDHPHVIVAKATSGARWLLENRFSDALDDYEPFFTVNALSAELSVDEIWGCFSRGEYKGESKINVRDIAFDTTRRAALRLTA